jgi:thiol-disulfide isomerase/thioredoxin
MKKIFFVIVATLLCLSSWAQQRTVLIEQFSNASCPTCAAFSPQVYDFADQNPANAVVITYHVPFPYTHDSLHYESPTDALARSGKYNVAGTPTSVMDGGFYNGSTSTLLNSLASRISQRIAVDPQYQIQIKNLQLNNGKVNGSVVFTSAADNSAANAKGYIVLLERGVPKTAYLASPGRNAESVYRNVMRSIFPTASGVTLVNKQIGGADSIALDIATTNVKSLSQLRVVAFVQNDANKEIYQANYSDLQGSTTGVEDFETFTGTWGYDVAGKQYHATFSTPVSRGSIVITDITGKKVLTQEISGQTAVLDVAALPSGIYIATVHSEAISHTTKLWVE